MTTIAKDFPNIPERLKGLIELSYNLWWSWHPEARMLFKTLDRQAWKESIHNPVKMLSELPEDVLESAANNPIPPLEACGTSGMKASLNGVLQLSILDGWWIEGFNGKNGWAFEGSGSDKGDADAMYNILEKKIVPFYYKLDNNGIPHDWIKFMKEAIKNTGPRFNARRMVKEYTTKFYQNALQSALRDNSEIKTTPDPAA